MTPGTLLTRTKHWIKTHRIHITKRLGQHFLINEAILGRIIEYAQLTIADRILEIGTGNGALTEVLAEHVQTVSTIEKDPHLYEILSKEFASNHKISLIHGDAVKTEWPESNKLVANLPYSISSPVLFRFFDSKIPMAVLMLQKEFAERLTAQTGSKQYGRLTIMAAYHATVELLEYVSPESFYPPPAVSSALVRIHRRTQPPFLVKNPTLFAQVTTTLFNQRRKKIRTPLKSLLTAYEFQNLREKIPWLHQRVEELSPHQIAKISNIIDEEQKR